MFDLLKSGRFANSDKYDKSDNHETGRLGVRMNFDSD